MPSLGLKQILILIGFAVILVSIPVSFTLVKNTQIFKSGASEKKPSAQQQTATKAKEATGSSSLSDLKNKIASPTSTVKTLSPTPTISLSFGPILTAKITIEGRAQDNQANKVFVGIVSGSAKIKPTYLLTYTLDFPASGIFSGISLAGLNPGSVYTAYLKGAAQIDVASTFTMGPTETLLNNNQPLNLTSGDLNEDNLINQSDLDIAKGYFGLTSKSSNFNSRADINADGIINNIDLAIIKKNNGKTGASGAWFSSPPSQATSSATPTPTPTSKGSTGGYWLWVPPQ